MPYSAKGTLQDTPKELYSITNKTYEGNIAATEMDHWRRICKPLRTDRITNDEIRRSMNVEKVCSVILKRNDCYDTGK